MGVLNGRASCFEVRDGFDDIGHAHIFVGIVVLEHQQNARMMFFSGNVCIGKLREIIAIAGNDNAILGNRVRENRIVRFAQEIGLSYRLHVMSGSG